MDNLVILDNSMDAYTATDAKQAFGEILMKSQREPVSVTRNGKPMAVIMSAEDFQALKQQALRAALIEGEQSGRQGPLDMADIKRLARLKAGLAAD